MSAGVQNRAGRDLCLREQHTKVYHEVFGNHTLCLSALSTFLCFTLRSHCDLERLQKDQPPHLCCRREERDSLWAQEATLEDVVCVSLSTLPAWLVVEWGARVSLLGRDQERAVAWQPEASNGVTPLLGGYQEQSQACLATLVLSMTHLCPHAVCVSGGSLSGVALS